VIKTLVKERWCPVAELKYKRILLKVSGEALLGDQEFGIDQKPVEMIANEVKLAHDEGAEIAIVVGGGNIFRGMKNSAKLGMDQASGDYVGMLATVMNAIALQSALRKVGVSCRVQSAIQMNQIAEPYLRFKAIRHLEKGRVVIFAAGTGNPFFTTDTASALRASEINANVMLMAKNGVDGIYSADPKTNPDAIKYDDIKYDDIIQNGLKVMDTASCDLCRQNNIPIVVFDFQAKGSIQKILHGEKLGTYVGQ
jgi:uridylate kinase